MMAGTGGLDEAGEPLAILRHGGAPCPLPQGLRAEGFGPFWLVSGPAAQTGLSLFRRRRAILKAAGARQAMLEGLMPLGPVLVLPPGQQADAAAFAPFVDELEAWADRLEGRVQFQLTLSWHRAAAAGRFAARCDGTEVGLDRLGQELAQQVTDRLSEVALDSIPLPTDAPEVLVHCVLLIDAAQEMRLDQVLEEIDALWPEGLRLRLVGPSPALSFALATLRPLAETELRAAADAMGAALPVLSGKALRALAPELPALRRTASLRGADAEAMALLMRLAGLALPAGLLDGMPLLEVRREGRAAPVTPASLPVRLACQTEEQGPPAVLRGRQQAGEMRA